MVQLCLYAFHSNVALILYVDGIILSGKHKRYVEEVVGLLKRYFDLKGLGKTKKLLGVEFEERNDYMHQISQTDEVCKCYRKYNFPISSLPISKGSTHSKISCP